MPDRRPLPNSNPLSALRKAETIGDNPIGDSHVRNAVIPIEQGMVEALGKPISELLGMILKPGATGTGLPSKLRIGGFDSAKGVVNFFGTRKGSESFGASLDEISQMLDNGMLQVEQPPMKGVDAIRRTLNRLLGAPEDVSPSMTPERLDSALQGIHDAVPLDPKTGMKAYNPDGHAVGDVFDLPIMRGVKRPTK